ncbi:E3 SUMO-protein ligase PIAS2 isoform X4 [Fundulus heteroclitus]|uniref:E3 SUMO-protein ligase PIAS2 isoform X4 n=1 Tax=Fundulus heteroclitus TaxID=8078 RepID=UPI00165CB197|nr:E3 SUMO-protein ligase PIAS2 isoform X4 [Fundulus heteroclitus]
MAALEARRPCGRQRPMGRLRIYVYDDDNDDYEEEEENGTEYGFTVHPDVQMKPLPFYDVLDVLVKPSSLGASPSQRYHQEKYFIFALTPQQVREVCISRDFLPGGRRDYMVQIQLRFCLAETSCPQDDNFPNSLCVKVNGKLFPLPGLAPPPKNGIEQKKSGRPLNITSLVRLSSAVPNQIAVTWAPEIGKTGSRLIYQ